MEINSTAESVSYFDSLICKTSVLPALEAYSARDGAQLTYRKYNSPQRRPKRILILLHGSGWHSQQFFKLAPELTSLGDVYTPDLRGHGPNPNQRGDVAYIGQLEDDLADFIEFLKFKHDDVAVTVLGHSSGGSLAIRFAAGLHGSLVDSFLLLAPYIHPTAPVTKRDQRWAAVSLPKLILIGFLNSFGFERFNNTKVIEFNLPKHLHDGKETLSYSYRLLTSINPRQKYMADISRLTQPTLLLIGKRDEIFYPNKFKELFLSRKNIVVKVVPDAAHLGILTAAQIPKEIAEWLAKITTTR